MKKCNKCGSNIEGLVHHCDCCGTPIIDNYNFLEWHSWELAFDFGEFVNQIMDEIDKEVNSLGATQFKDLLNKLRFVFYCYPESMAMRHNLQNRVYYSATNKIAKVTIIIDYNSFVCADKRKKKQMIADSINQNIHLLQIRLQKSKINIEAIVDCTNAILLKYQ